MKRAEDVLLPETELFGPLRQVEGRKARTCRAARSALGAAGAVRPLPRVWRPTPHAHAEWSDRRRAGLRQIQRVEKADDVGAAAQARLLHEVERREARHIYIAEEQELIAVVTGVPALVFLDAAGKQARRRRAWLFKIPVDYR